ncbi:BTAD domain-containing putative transcriptional regulator [uncultured Phycicoccus sp.]|uniref:BTAD domain-containing putative transcriptional regulator n=1 Tax=uncultured Phycicoccus sp. TaxID=661422 RepID=UPI00260AAAC0|nr:BTAD domain-containing putative transcriptional regulator [uncultured Phycicoccus sp.]
MEVAVLGAVEVRAPGGPLDLGTPRQRSLLAALALSAGRPVPVDVLVDLLWGETPPPGVTTTLQAYVAGLRKVLEPDRPRRAPARVLVTAAPGYALRVPEAAQDSVRFDAAVREQHRRLSGPLLDPPALGAEELEAAVAALDEALGWWRGTPFLELGEAAAAVAQRAHLEELRVVAHEDRAAALLALGRHGTTAAELEALTAQHPLRERLWALRVLALTRAGRQADALDALRQVRRLLDRELGIDPGAELRTLQNAVLRQDPALSWRPPPRASARPAPTTGEPAGPAVHRRADVAPWPLLGRDHERAALLEALAAAADGRTRFAAVSGDPGIGKTRLSAELAEDARARGLRVAVGHCSQDEGAPPLHPWLEVLEGLGLEAPDVAGAGPGDDFRAWDHVVRRVRQSTADGPVVVVIDDLHWADSASLRVLRLLADTTREAPLLGIVTWRDRPAPSGLLADVLESLTRAHALRLALGGLAADDVAGIVTAVTAQPTGVDDARRLRERTDGNPFLVVEYARTAAHPGGAGSATGGLAGLLDDAGPPAAVQELLARRVERLPERTADVLRRAAVLGRHFDDTTLVALVGGVEDEVLEVLEPAVYEGLVREEGIGRFAFAHALVRDAVYTRLGPTRRARWHAVAAGALADQPGRESEEAHHWLAAGPRHAAQAWPAARRAARSAVSAHAHDEAVSLLRSALDAMTHDPASTARDRYDALMELVAASRWAARWDELTTTVEAAIAVAEELGDVERLARAAVATTEGVLWQSAPEGEAHPGVVAALRRALAELPAGDSPLRARCLLGLATETYYADPHDERRRLVDEALHMAARIGDPGLLMAAHQVGFMALLCGDPAHERLAHADEALAAARRAGDEQGALVSTTLRAVALSELGRTAELWPAVRRARAEALRLRVPFGELVLDNMVVPWLAMAGRWTECEEALTRLRAHVHTGIHQAVEALEGAELGVAVWSGRPGEAADALATLLDGPFPLAATVAAYRWRAGDEDGARAVLAEHPVDVTPQMWLSPVNWAHAACLALYLGDPALAREVRHRLAPLSGHACTAGSGMASGPADAYLAFAAAACGDGADASALADAALAQCAQWEIPVFAEWFAGERARHGF